MTHYYQQIKKIKEFGSVDYIKFKYQNKFVTFRLVDTSEETIRHLTNWRKNNRFMFGTNFEMSEKRTLDWIKNNLKERKDWILFIINIIIKFYLQFLEYPITPQAILLPAFPVFKLSSFSPNPKSSSLS